MFDNLDPFPGAASCILDAAEKARVIVLSQSTEGALRGQWGNAGLLDVVSSLYGQEAGSKAANLKREIEGFEPKQGLMVGDGPGDRRAARGAGVAFFPIIPGREAESWERLSEGILPRLFAGLPFRDELEAWNENFDDVLLGS